MRYLVTGGAGFLGRVVCQKLRQRPELNADIIVLRSSDCDLTRQDQTEKMMTEIRPDVVIHLAARVGGIGANRENPGLYFYSNAIMGINLIEAARLGKIRKFVQVGTICG